MKKEKNFKPACANILEVEDASELTMIKPPFKKDDNHVKKDGTVPDNRTTHQNSHVGTDNINPEGG